MPMFFENAISIIGNLQARAYAVNLTHIETEKSHFASFMSIGWGLLADIGLFFVDQIEARIFFQISKVRGIGKFWGVVGFSWVQSLESLDVSLMVHSAIIFEKQSDYC